MAENESNLLVSPLPTEDEVIEQFKLEMVPSPVMLGRVAAANPVEEDVTRTRELRSARRAPAPMARSNGERMYANPSEGYDFTYKVKLQIEAYVSRLYPTPVQEVIAPCPMPTLGEFPGVDWEFQKREYEKAKGGGGEAFVFGIQECSFIFLCDRRERWYAVAKEFNIDVEGAIKASIERWKVYAREVARVNKLRYDAFVRLGAEFEAIKEKARLRIEEELREQAKRDAKEADRKLNEFLKEKSTRWGRLLYFWVHHAPSWLCPSWLIQSDSRRIRAILDQLPDRGHPSST